MSEDEEPEKPQPPPRVTPTPEWLGMQDAKQIRYELRRAMWKQQLKLLDE